MYTLLPGAASVFLHQTKSQVEDEAEEQTSHPCAQPSADHIGICKLPPGPDSGCGCMMERYSCVFIETMVEVLISCGGVTA